MELPLQSLFIYLSQSQPMKLGNILISYNNDTRNLRENVCNTFTHSF